MLLSFDFICPIEPEDILRLIFSPALNDLYGYEINIVNEIKLFRRYRHSLDSIKIIKNDFYCLNFYFNKESLLEHFKAEYQNLYSDKS